VIILSLKANNSVNGVPGRLVSWWGCFNGLLLGSVFDPMYFHVLYFLKFWAKVI